MTIPVTAPEILGAHKADANQRTAPHQPAGRLARGQIADRLTEMADLLEAQEANRFRIRAYRQGAATVRTLNEDPAHILSRAGLKGLTDLPNIGPRLARATDETGAPLLRAAMDEFLGRAFLADAASKSGFKEDEIIF